MPWFRLEFESKHLNFPLDVRKDVSEHSGIDIWDEISSDFRCLEWWATYTELGGSIAECWYKTSDIDADLLLEICLRSELKMCSKKTFSRALSAGDFTYNSHKMANTSDISWEDVLPGNPREAAILERSKKLCKSYFADECGQR